MKLFHVIEDAFAIVRSRGVYRQVKVYRRGTEIFVAHGGGYAKLVGMHGCTVPDLYIVDIEAKGVKWDRPTSQPKWEGAVNE
jgi:hypothetical protein